MISLYKKKLPNYLNPYHLTDIIVFNITFYKIIPKY